MSRLRGSTSYDMGSGRWQVYVLHAARACRDEVYGKRETSVAAADRASATVTRRHRAGGNARCAGRLRRLPLVGQGGDIATGTTWPPMLPAMEGAAFSILRFHHYFSADVVEGS